MVCAVCYVEYDRSLTSFLVLFCTNAYFAIHTAPIALATQTPSTPSPTLNTCACVAGNVAPMTSGTKPFHERRSLVQANGAVQSAQAR